MKIVDDLPDGTRVFSADQDLPQPANMNLGWGINRYLVYAADTRRLYTPQISYGWMKCWDLVRDYKKEEETKPDSWADELVLEE